MARYSTPVAIKSAVDALTHEDVHTQQAQAVLPVVDLVRGIPVVRDGMFATMIDATDASKGKVLGYAKYGWMRFEDRKALAKAIKNALGTWLSPVPTQSLGFVEGFAVQFAPADAFAYGCDLNQITDENGEIQSGCMLFTLPAYLAAQSGKDAPATINIPVSERVRDTQSLTSHDIVKGVELIRGGSTRTLASRRAFNGEILPALIVPAVEGGEVFSEGTAKPEVAKTDPFAGFSNAAQVVPATVEAPQVTNRYAAPANRFARNFGGAHRRYRNN